ncbi:MAG: imidazolonepropionase [Actinomycetota bacterium]|nr:imidazolonepropionase [Actinomycetota bacterium]
MPQGVHRLLVRDLSQVASPAGGPAPLRGPQLADVHVVEDAFVLIRDGAIESVGRMRDLTPLDGDVEEVDGRGLSAIPGLVDCHTHPAWGGDRVEEFSLRAAGAAYEELHAAGGGILSTVRATRALGEDGLQARVDRHAAWMLRHGTTTWEGKSGYGLDRDTELASLRAVRAAGGSPTWLGAHAVPPEFDDGDAYLDFALAEVLPDAAGLAEAADVFLERGAFDANQARRYLEACRRAGLALRLHGDQFSESGAIPLAVELGARSVDHLEATGPDGARTLAASEVTGVLLPASALFLDRPMPPGRALVDAGAAVALATDFNPGSSFTTSLPLVCSLACTKLRLAPAEALSAVTANAAHVLGRGADRGRIAPGRRADLVLLDAADWRYLAYHLAGDVVAAVVADGRIAYRR